MKPGIFLKGAAFTVMAGIVAAVVVPVFASARAAAQLERELEGTQKLVRALGRFTSDHDGRLPGKDWRKQLQTLDPKLSEVLAWRRGDEYGGFAAIPGTQGAMVEKLTPETLLFVEYRSRREEDFLSDLSDLGGIRVEDRVRYVDAVRALSGQYGATIGKNEAAAILRTQCSAAFK